MGSGNKAESSGGNRSEEGGEEIIDGEILRTWMDPDDQDGRLNYHWPEKLDLSHYAHPDINC